jgi:hypothetical protein
MDVALPHECGGMVAALADPMVPITYFPKFREFEILVEGRPIGEAIEFCPWCGARLPKSLRDPYFDHLETLGLEPESNELPLDLRSDAWWRMRNL